MNPILRNILFLTVFSFALMLDCLYFGVQYDTYHKISPEIGCGGCYCDEMYGARWTRIAEPLIYFFLGSFVAVFVHLYREDQLNNYNKLSIFKS
jgi:hypothetical protein